MERMKKTGRTCRKRNSFTKIWIRIAVPVWAVSIVALLLFLWITLIYLADRQRMIASEIAYEQTYVIREADLSSFEEISKALHMEKFQMVAALYDGQGNLLGESRTGGYDGWKIPGEKYKEVLVRLKEMEFAEQRTVPGFEEVDLFGNSCLYGREIFIIGQETYTLRFAKVVNPWVQQKDFFLLTGVLVMAGMGILTLVIAGQYYGIYKERIKAEEYYKNTANALAHNLKTPLMAISGYAEMLHENVHVEKRNYYTESILRNIVAMNDIVESMLELSKRENPQRNLNKKMTGLSIPTEEVVEKSQAEIL